MIKLALTQLTFFVLAAQTLATPAAAQTMSGRAATATDPATAADLAPRRFTRLHGDRIRVGAGSGGTVVPGVTVSGWLLDSYGDTLVIQSDTDGEPVEVVVGHALRVERWTSTNHSKAFAILGSLAGMAIGGAIGQAVNKPPERIVKPCHANTWGEAFGCALGASIANGLNEAADEGGAIAAGALIGGVALGVAGSIIGNKTAFEGWRAVNPLRLRVRRRTIDQVDIGFEIRH